MTVLDPPSSLSGLLVDAIDLLAQRDQQAVADQLEGVLGPGLTQAVDDAGCVAAPDRDPQRYAFLTA